MNALENELRGLRKEYSDMISAEKRARLERLVNILKEMGKHPFFK